MSTMKIIGILLVVLGLAGIVLGGITYTTRETVVDLGPIQATRDKEHTVPLPPIAGALALLAGTALLLTKQRTA